MAASYRLLIERLPPCEKKWVNIEWMRLHLKALFTAMASLERHECRAVVLGPGGVEVLSANAHRALMDQMYPGSEGDEDIANMTQEVLGLIVQGMGERERLRQQPKEN